MSKGNYGYKFELPAVALVRLRAPKKPKFNTKELQDKMANADVKLTRDVDTDIALINHFVYGCANVEDAKAKLIEDLPKIRSLAGVQLTKGDIQKGFDSGSIKAERVKH